MNFNFNNQRTKYNIASPIMRHFGTFGFVHAKPELSEYILKPNSIFQNVQNNFFSTLPGNVLPNKSFSNPNFVNKENPNILNPSVAGAFKLSNCHENLKLNSHTQQPKHDNYTHKHVGDSPKVYQPLPDKISSQNSPQSIVHKPEMPTISTSNENTINDTINLSPKSTKKIRNRNRRNRKNAKRQKQDSISLEPITEQKSNMTGKKNCKFNCSSPKKFKKSQDSKQKSRKSNKRCKPWHKISFSKEIMECDEPMTPDTAEIFESAPKDGFCLQIKSSPIEISPKCNGILSEALSISISPCTEFLKNLSTSNSSSEVMSCSPSSPAIRRLRLPSECDSEDSFIVFCDDDIDSLSEEISSEEETESEEDSESDSDFDVVDFIRKTDLNRVPAKKKVTFACDTALCTVHPMVQWGYAYHAARRGPWEEIARDRARFETRISKTSSVLNAILDPEHRAKVYRDRFQE